MLSTEGDLEKILILIGKIESKGLYKKDVYELLRELTSKRGLSDNEVSKRQYQAFRRINNALSTLILNIEKVRKDIW